ncbi:MAG TPA: autotransporter-associated beta strand repeat-containing protein [Verrucomicrobiae bacterium]|jgi:autotransporter-associated beta strand protein
MKFNALRPTGGVSSNLLQSVAAALLFCAAAAPAAQLVWDPLNNGGITPASGNWDTSASNTFWYNGSGDVAWTQTSTTAGLNGAVFGGADGNWAITNDTGQIAMTNLTINNSGYAFYGNNLDISSGDLMNLAPGKTVSFYCNLAADNNAKNYIAGAGSVVNIFGNVLGQQAKFIGPAASAYYLSGVNTPTVLYNLAPVYLTNGSITTSASFFVGYGQTVAGTAYTTGSLTISGGATATQNGNVLMVGRGGGNGTLTLLDGTVNVGTTANHDLAVCYDASGGEMGTLNVYGGTLNVGASGLPSKLDFFDTAGSGAGAVAVMTQTNGIVNAWGGVIFGAASGAFTGGSASMTNLGGFLYVGGGGINRGAGSPPTVNVSLSGGTVGALASWSSTLPMTLAPDAGNITFQSSDSFGDPFSIALSGPLSGAGGLNVDGTGTVALSGSNTYTGNTVVSNGTLAIVTGSFPTNGIVTVDGSAGSPTLSVRVANRGQYWSTGTLTYTSGTPTADFQFSSLTPSPAVAALQINGDLVFTTTPTVTVEGTALAAGTYPLIQYTGNLVGTAPSSVALPGGVTGALQNDTGAKTISLVISSSPFLPAVTWAVGNGAWDTTTFNWKQFGVPTNYADGDVILFDDSASGSSPITVTLNTTVNPESVTANNTAKNYTVAGAGSITGSGELEVLGGGTLTLDTANTYTGATILNAGQLNINNGGSTATATAIGTGPLYINAGALDNTSGSNVTLKAAIPESWGGSFSYVGSSNNFNTGSGFVFMNASLSLTVNSNDFTVGGPISDSGANLTLTKTGNGALTLPVGNSIGGGVTLQSGQLNLGDPYAAGTGLFAIVSGAIDNISGAPLSLSPASCQWVGNFTVVGTANLDLGASGIVDNSGPLTVTVLSNTFSTEGNITSGNSVITKAGNGTWVIGGGYSSLHQLQLSVVGGEVDLDKSVNAIGLGSSGLTVQSNGLVVDMIGGQIYHGSGTYVPVVISGGVLDLNGQSERVDEFSINSGGTLRNSAAAAVSSLSIDTTNTLQLGGTNCQFTVTDIFGVLNINTIIAGSGSLVKNGVGLLNLESNNTYTGSTIINSGTLALPGVSSISSTANIDLATAGASLDLSANTDTNGNSTPVLTLLSGQTLSGFGAVTGLVQTVSGSTLAPGSASAIGTLTLAGEAGTNMLNGNTVMKLNGDSLTSDLLYSSGSLNYGGTLVLTTLSGSLAAGDSFTLFNAVDGYSGAFSSIVPSRPGFPAFGLAWNTNNLAINGTLSIVPASVPPSPKISGVSVSGTTLSIHGTNGAANEPFVLLQSASLALPLADWTPVLTNSFDASGNFNVSIGVTNQPSEFFTVEVQ